MSEIGRKALLRFASSSLAARAVFLALGVASLLIDLHSTGRLALGWQRIDLATAYAQPELGHCYLTEVGAGYWHGYFSAFSPAELSEDGEVLGSSNALHQDVRAKGGGRHSFWGRHLYFSSSDNSDPRTNGRRYEVRRPYPINRGVAWSVLGATILAAFWCWPPWTRLSVSRAPWPAASGDPLFWAAVVFVLAWVVRLLAYVDVSQHPERYVGNMMMGVPFSDAQQWDSLRETVAQGHGLEGIGRAAGLFTPSSWAASINGRALRTRRPSI
jgi:hypothetical protein